MRPDPPPRKDGKCVVCGGPRRGKTNPYSRDEVLLDPFCSATCARAWHGCALPDNNPKKAHTKGVIRRDAGFQPT